VETSSGKKRDGDDEEFQISKTAHAAKGGNDGTSAGTASTRGQRPETGLNNLKRRNPLRGRGKRGSVEKKREKGNKKIKIKKSQTTKRAKVGFLKMTRFKSHRLRSRTSSGAGRLRNSNRKKK
jgi:hypothetical protein